MAGDDIFAGLKVVDLASFIADPSAAVILSDLGADVAKVEPPDIGLRYGWSLEGGPRDDESEAAGRAAA